MKSKINIYYHVSLINNGYIIAAEQLHLLALSGLMYRAKSLNIGITYDSKAIIDYTELFFKLLHEHNIMKNMNIVYMEDNQYNNKKDFSMGIYFKEYADSLPDDRNEYVFFFHTKGVGWHKTEYDISTRYWRQYMEYFMIENWRDCYRALEDSYESCGTHKVPMKIMNDHSGIVNTENENRFIYPGSYYWMNTSLIKRIPKSYFYIDNPHGLYAIEALPGFVDHKQKFFSETNPPGMNLYKQVLHPAQYMK